MPKNKIRQKLFEIKGWKNNQPSQSGCDVTKEKRGRFRRRMTWEEGKSRVKLVKERI